MTFGYLDTEATGLDPMRHEPWEVAYAIDEGPILSTFLPLEKFVHANVEALEIGGFSKRYQAPQEDWAVKDFLDEMVAALTGVTLVGSNPRFDEAMLQHGYWSGDAQSVTWSYRLLDVPTYAMGFLGHEKPMGLHIVAAELLERGYSIPSPDHTAAGDVACVRACHRALMAAYGARTVDA